MQSIGTYTLLSKEKGTVGTFSHLVIFYPLVCQPNRNFDQSFEHGCPRSARPRSRFPDCPGPRLSGGWRGVGAVGDVNFIFSVLQGMVNRGAVEFLSLETPDPWISRSFTGMSSGGLPLPWFSSRTAWHSSASAEFLAEVKRNGNPEAEVGKCDGRPLGQQPEHSQTVWGSG